MHPYNPPPILFTPHLETIYPALFRKVDIGPFRRERISTPDDDFLDLDWLTRESSKLVILSHGLEGNSSRAYIKGMARAFQSQGFDVLAWTYRGCGDEMNRQLRFYHSGATDDLDVVIQHANKTYSEIYLVGFSLGGNLTLKYLGERGTKVLSAIKKAVAFSVPMDLYTSCLEISKPGNWMYSGRFLRSLKTKVKTKASKMPGIDLTGIDSINNLKDFDDRYTAPIHGFQDAMQYYERSSSERVIQNISIPTLVVNAQNDPFLSPECSPVDKLKGHAKVILETPVRGGHVGFTLFDKNGLYWSELRALEFITS